MKTTSNPEFEKYLNTITVKGTLFQANGRGRVRAIRGLGDREITFTAIAADGFMLAQVSRKFASTRKRDLFWASLKENKS